MEATIAASTSHIPSFTEGPLPPTQGEAEKVLEGREEPSAERVGQSGPLGKRVGDKGESGQTSPPLGAKYANWSHRLRFESLRYILCFDRNTPDGEDAGDRRVMAPFMVEAYKIPKELENPTLLTSNVLLREMNTSTIKVRENVLSFFSFFFFFFFPLLSSSLFFFVSLLTLLRCR